MVGNLGVKALIQQLGQKKVKFFLVHTCVIPQMWYTKKRKGSEQDAD